MGEGGVPFYYVYKKISIINKTINIVRKSLRIGREQQKTIRKKTLKTDVFEAGTLLLRHRNDHYRFHPNVNNFSLIAFLKIVKFFS